MAKLSNQMANGKAFEYSLLSAFFDRLHGATSVSVIENAPYATAKFCFESFGALTQDSLS